MIQIIKILEKTFSFGPIDSTCSTFNSYLVSILYFLFMLVHDSSYEGIVDHRLISDVGKQKTTRSISNFCLIDLQLMSVGRGLLIA